MNAAFKKREFPNSSPLSSEESHHFSLSVLQVNLTCSDLKEATPADDLQWNEQGPFSFSLFFSSPPPIPEPPLGYSESQGECSFFDLARESLIASISTATAAGLPQARNPLSETNKTSASPFFP